jgi:hypothetical protein
MTPDAITLLFKEARNTFPPLKGKPMDNNLMSIGETLLPILMNIPYDQLEGVHSLMAILVDTARYATNRGNTFKRPDRLPLYNSSIANNATLPCTSTQSQSTSPALTTTPSTRWPSVVLPSSFVRWSTRYGIMISRMPTPSTQR